jgi:hypothetical protein
LGPDGDPLVGWPGGNYRGCIPGRARGSDLTALATATRDGAQRQTTVEFLPGGVEGDFAAKIFGESRTRFEDRQRHTINRIYADGTIATVFHEDFHGFRREARASGRITREEEITFLRMLDGAMAGKTDKSGRAIRFLPEGIADDAITDVQLDEAMSELAETEILRRRRPHKGGDSCDPVLLGIPNLMPARGKNVARIGPGMS